MNSTKSNQWICSAPFDLGLIIGPPVVSVLLVLFIPALQSVETPVWGWVVFVVFVDVAHVYASLYRTYFDPAEFQRRKHLYLSVPVLCFAGGAAIYIGLGYLMFWRLLAYLAVFHFVRQQFGFLMLYKHRAGERDVLDRRIDKAVIYLTMLYPLAFWHQSPGERKFEWFVKNDFMRLPEWTAKAVLLVYSLALLVFAIRQIQRYLQYGTVNWGKLGIVGSTASVWYVGIVYLNSDFAFTITNVVAHGVPYIALVWLYGRRRWVSPDDWRTKVHRPGLAALFIGLLLLLAYVEEGFWDFFVWHEHADVFGGLSPGFELSPIATALAVSLLMVPQTTHYILDAWIWKFDGSNPGLKEYLFGE
jgi:hypothetical protein